MSTLNTFTGTDAMAELDPDIALVAHLIDYQAPKNEDVIAQIQVLRKAFKKAAHLLIDFAPRTPDRTVAIRKIHDACQASIAALVLNQEEIS
jgi:hypothetical protein